MDSLEEEHQRILDLLGAETREPRLSLRTLFHRVIERIDNFPAGLLDVPDELRIAVYPDRYGMMCYKVKLVGSQPVQVIGADDFGGGVKGVVLAGMTPVRRHFIFRIGYFR